MSRIAVSPLLGTQGFSATARYIQDATRKNWQRLRESHLFGVDSAVFQELATVADECRNADWDGYGALGVTQDTLRTAYCLLESLPLGFPAPSIGAEPDGHLTLEWHRSPRRTLSVSVSPDGDLHYAALFGPSRVFGTEPFIGEIPETILRNIRRVYQG